MESTITHKKSDSEENNKPNAEEDHKEANTEAAINTTA
jgi:hypothetical protein